LLSSVEYLGNNFHFNIKYLICSFQIKCPLIDADDSIVGGTMPLLTQLEPKIIRGRKKKWVKLGEEREPEARKEEG
jgi:hypothetical protein